MPNADLWNERFREDVTDRPVFGGAPNPTVAQIIEPWSPRTITGHHDSRTAAIRERSTGVGYRAIDLGCGRGRHVVWLASQGWDTTGLDFSEVGIEHTRQALADAGLEAELVLCDLNHWQPEEKSYDLILSAFMHFSPAARAEFWGKIALALAPGGHAVVIAHHPVNTGHGPKDPIMLYDANDVTAAFASVDEGDFHIERADRNVNSGNEADPSEGPVAVDTVVVIRREA